MTKTKEQYLADYAATLAEASAAIERKDLAAFERAEVIARAIDKAMKEADKTQK